MDLTQIVEFLNNEIVGYAIQSVVGFGSGFVGVCALLKRAKKTISDTTTVLGETNTNSSNTNKEVAKTRESVEETKQSVLALKEEVRKEREDLKLQKEQLQQELKVQREELMAEFKATMNTVNEFVDSLQPLLNLPQAFAQSVSLNAESVRNGAARKVNDILGFNKDNLQTNATQNTKANNLFKGIQLNLNNKKQEEEKK